MTEVTVMAKIRVNLANHAELMEIPGLAQADADAIVRFRNQHGPIRDATELASVVGTARMSSAAVEHIDFDPADATAPEAPGA